MKLKMSRKNKMINVLQYKENCDISEIASIYYLNKKMNRLFSQ